MTGIGRVALVGLALVGCTKEATEAPPLRRFSAEELTRTSGRVVFTLRTHDDAFTGTVENQEHRVTIEPSTIESQQPCAGRRYVRRAEVWIGAEKSYEQEDHLCLGPEGLAAYAGSNPLVGELTHYEAPEVILPPQVMVGSTWNAYSSKSMSGLRCRAFATPFCELGVAVECTTDNAYVRWTRHHYCSGQGWVAMEATSFEEEEPELRALTGPVVADGVAGRAVPEARRPLPGSASAARSAVGLDGDAQAELD